MGNLYSFPLQARLNSQDAKVLRARVDAALAKFDVSLPEGDAGLVEAARRAREMRLHYNALYRDFAVTMEIEEAEIIGRYNPVRERFEDFLIETEPQTLAAAVTVAQWALDDGGILGDGENATVIVGNLLALLERVQGGAA